jgi:hypothetical protein
MVTTAIAPLRDLAEMVLQPGIIVSQKAERDSEGSLTAVLADELRPYSHGRGGTGSGYLHVDETHPGSAPPAAAAKKARVLPAGRGQRRE